MRLAKKMIKEAANSGADYCKFQSWRTENLKRGPWDKDGRVQIYKKAELKKTDYFKLLKYCKDYKVKFMTSIFNIDDLDFLTNLKFDTIKIPSHEVYNIKLIKACTKKFKNILISVGACKWSEFLKLKKNINNKKVHFLHCVSSYPLDRKYVNFHKYFKLKKILKQVGYSGHLQGIDDALFAISNNANFVEKHFTVDQSLPGRDNKFAILPKEMKKLSEYRDSVFEMNISRGLNLQKCEKDIYKNYRGRWG